GGTGLAGQEVEGVEDVGQVEAAVVDPVRLTPPVHEVLTDDGDTGGGRRPVTDVGPERLPPGSQRRPPGPPSFVAGDPQVRGGEASGQLAAVHRGRAGGDEVV